MRGKLTKIISANNNLRTNEVEGGFDSLPEVGKPFEMIGKSLTEGFTSRYIGTSPVVEVFASPNIITFVTQNSTYNLEVEKE